MVLRRGRVRRRRAAPRRSGGEDARVPARLRRRRGLSRRVRRAGVPAHPASVRLGGRRATRGRGRGDAESPGRRLHVRRRARRGETNVRKLAPQSRRHSPPRSPRHGRGGFNAPGALHAERPADGDARAPRRRVRTRRRPARGGVRPSVRRAPGVVFLRAARPRADAARDGVVTGRPLRGEPRGDVQRGEARADGPGAGVAGSVRVARRGRGGDGADARRGERRGRTRWGRGRSRGGDSRGARRRAPMRRRRVRRARRGVVPSAGTAGGDERSFHGDSGVRSRVGRDAREAASPRPRDARSRRSRRVGGDPALTRRRRRVPDAVPSVRRRVDRGGLRRIPRRQRRARGRR